MKFDELTRAMDDAADAQRRTRHVAEELRLQKTEIELLRDSLTRVTHLFDEVTRKIGERMTELETAFTYMQDSAEGGPW
jgi:signal transduction histidine kinase